MPDAEVVWFLVGVGCGAVIEPALRALWFRWPAILPLPPTGASRAVLYRADGTIDSVRTLKGPAPKEFTRPHGKEPATIYRLVRKVGPDVVYRQYG